MNWSLTLVLCIVLVEVFLRMPFLPSLVAITRTTARSMRVMRARGVSDHWKEKAMGAYARRTFMASLTLAGLLLAIAALATVLIVAFEQVSAGFGSFVLSWTGLIASVLAATLYVAVRRKVLHV